MAAAGMSLPVLALAACVGSPVSGLKAQERLDTGERAWSSVLDAASDAGRSSLHLGPSVGETLASGMGHSIGSALAASPTTTQPAALGSSASEHLVREASSVAGADAPPFDEGPFELRLPRDAGREPSGRGLILGLVLGTLTVCAAVPVLFSQGWLPFASVLAYIVSLVSVKLCVKEVFNSGYPYPYATTAFHMLVTAIVASCIERPGGAGARDTFLISVVKCASLALNNTALLFGTAAFVSILGACTPASTYAVEICRYCRTTTSKTLSTTAVVVGAVLCVKGELAFSLLATVLALGACLCRSLKTVWSHDLMQVDMSPYRLAAWTAVWSFALMAPATMIKEGLAPFTSFPDTSLHTKVVFFAGSMLATLLNVLACFVLKYLGPLQQNIFGQLELVVVLTLATVLLHETVTTMQQVGVVLIGVGCLLSKSDAVSALSERLMEAMPPRCRSGLQGLRKEMAEDTAADPQLRHSSN